MNERWALLEVLGHNQAHGLIEEVVFAGAPMVQSSTPLDAECAMWKVQLLGAASIYRLTWADKATVLGVLFRSEAVAAIGRSRWTEGDDDDLDDDEPLDQWHCVTTGCGGLTVNEDDALCLRCQDHDLDVPNAIRCVDPDCLSAPHARACADCVDYDPESPLEDRAQVAAFFDREPF